MSADDDDLLSAVLSESGLDDLLDLSEMGGDDSSAKRMVAGEDSAVFSSSQISPGPISEEFPARNSSSGPAAKSDKTSSFLPATNRERIPSTQKPSQRTPGPAKNLTTDTVALNSTLPNGGVDASPHQSSSTSGRLSVTRPVSGTPTIRSSTPVGTVRGSSGGPVKYFVLVKGKGGVSPLHGTPKIFNSVQGRGRKPISTLGGRPAPRILSSTPSTSDSVSTTISQDSASGLPPEHLYGKPRPLHSPVSRNPLSASPLSTRGVVARRGVMGQHPSMTLQSGGRLHGSEPTTLRTMRPPQSIPRGASPRFSSISNRARFGGGSYSSISSSPGQGPHRILYPGGPRMESRSSPGTPGGKYYFKRPPTAQGDFRADIRDISRAQLSGARPINGRGGPGTAAKMSGVKSARPIGGLRTTELGPSRKDPGKSKDPSKNAAAEPEDDEEALSCAETYADYRPSKLRSGLSHPDSVVETSSLASVQPPDIRYHISIPEEAIDTGKLSALQLEAIIYASQQHDTRLPSQERTGYLIGDGAGVGKGRTLSGIIYENYLLGRKRSMWFSVSADLKWDAERDLRDIGAKIKVHALNKLNYSKISGKENGKIKKGVIFATYSSLIGESHNSKGKYRSRLRQLIQWFGEDYDGVIVFDECHRAKNLVPAGSQKPTKTGQAVLELQKRLPNARVVYASATGATEPRNMAYMTRLGLWGEGKSFPEFTDFINAVERRGVGAMEIVAMDMKQRGLYLARQLSFAGVSFKIEEVPLSREFVQVYDQAAKLWIEARKQFQVAGDLIHCGKNQKKAMWGQFWAAHQRFFKYLCIASKVRACVKLARMAVKNGKCVIIGLQSTGEAKTLEQLEEGGGELSDFVSTAKGVFQGLVEKHFPAAGLFAGGAFSSTSDFFSEYESFLPKDRNRGLKRRAESPTDSWAKRVKDDPDAEEEADEDDDEEEDSEGSDSDSSTDGEVEEGKGDDWVEKLFCEAASSSDEEDEEEEEEEEDEEDDPEKEEKESDLNPFSLDDEDIWSDQQQIVEEEKKKPDDSKRELKRAQKAERRAKRKREKRAAKLAKIQAEKQKRLEQPGYTADEFLSKARDIPEKSKNPELQSSQAEMMKAELLASVERLGNQLPPNTLDQLISELGGTEMVAEMTGRKGRVVNTEDGQVQYELRHVNDVPLERLNIEEKERFMNGSKMIAVISEAASSGISLQSDRRAQNQARRVHITLELPWSADKAVQQFGRSHRSNQVSAPEYVFLISELAGEKRFASVVAKRLESLGALTHGDRRAAETRDLSQFNVDTKFGRKALEEVLNCILGVLKPPRVPPPPDYPNFFNEMQSYLEGVGVFVKNGQSFTIEKDSATLSKFLNRILGIPVHAQNNLFQYFAETLTGVTEEARKDGRFDMGILDLGIGGDNVHKLETHVFLGRAELGSCRTEIHKISVERGLPWDDAYLIYMDHQGDDDGFYLSTMTNLGRKFAALVCSSGKKRLDSGDRLYRLYRPNTGASTKMETLAEIKTRFKRVLPDEAETVWKEQFDSSASQCQHTFWYGSCKNEQAGFPCEVGRRRRNYFVMSGSVLSVWPLVESILQNGPGKLKNKMQVIRVHTSDGQKIVGVLIPNSCAATLKKALDEHCGRSYIEAEKKRF